MITNKPAKQWAQDTMKKIDEKLLCVRERSAEKIPSRAINGTHDNKADGRQYDADNGISWWTNGFWAGILWLEYSRTNDEKYMRLARFTQNKLNNAMSSFTGLHHDIGFMWLTSSVADYKLTGCEKAKTTALHAASLLAGRFNPAGFIRAWNNIPNQDSDTRGWVIIDSMFNIPLLFWASEETKDPRFSKIARIHANTVLENFIRDNASVRHIVELDCETGEYKDDFGGQGIEKGSSWTRGQAWGLYGFVNSYKHTNDEKYLIAAKKIADYFIDNLPKNGVVPVDFAQNVACDWRDDIAACVAACGLIEIAQLYTKDKKYFESALAMLNAVDKCCDYSSQTDGIIQKASAAYHCEEHNVNYTYGDFFYMEALQKLCGEKISIW